MPNIAIPPLIANDREWVSQFIFELWGSNKVISRGIIYYPQELPGFKAMLDGEKVGLLTYNIVDDSCEIVTINSTHSSSGVGTALIEAVKNIARKSGCRRLWLITTNDNMHALHFYQKRDFVLVAALEYSLLEQMWAGLRPKTPDNQPILGPAPGWDNVTLAIGHGSVGIMQSAITGQTIAELILKGTVPKIVQPFSLARFKNNIIR